MDKMKVIIIDNELMPYRIPIFNMLAQTDGVELTVAHSGNLLQGKVNLLFEEGILDTYSLSRFVFYKKDLFQYLQSFDIVIASYEIRRLSLMFLPLFKHRNFKIIFWGIGVRGSYAHRLGATTVWDTIRFYFAKHADALIFYSPFPIPIYEKKGFDPKKLFVANNTVQVSNKLGNTTFQRDRIIFVGSLYKEKKIYQLLKSYRAVYNRNPSIPCLDIVGDGDEMKAIRDYIERNALSSKIILHGAIFDEEKLEELFKHAIVSISPDQAGLSVLKCMAYGVPYITQKNAITGGERLNIKHNINGILFDYFEEIELIIDDVILNPSRYLKMGENAKQYYNEFASPKRMVQGFMDAIHYVNALTYAKHY
jgi:glycosyltransferase involved in cell wall biosynthesis